MRVIDTSGLRSFRIPLGGEAGTPVELLRHGGELGSDARADVRLMVARRSATDVSHDRFADLGDSLDAGDLLVVNTSAVIPAALDARGTDGTELRLHLSTEQPGGFWVVEPRRPAGPGTERYVGSPPTHLVLPGGGRAELLAPYPAGTGLVRLWLARIDVQDGRREARVRDLHDVALPLRRPRVAAAPAGGRERREREDQQEAEGGRDGQAADHDVPLFRCRTLYTSRRGSVPPRRAVVPHGYPMLSASARASALRCCAWSG